VIRLEVQLIVQVKLLLMAPVRSPAYLVAKSGVVQVSKVPESLTG
jgi:hypothetical protein